MSSTFGYSFTVSLVIVFCSGTVTLGLYCFLKRNEMNRRRNCYCLLGLILCIYGLFLSVTVFFLDYCLQPAHDLEWRTLEHLLYVAYLLAATCSVKSWLKNLKEMHEQERGRRHAAVYFSPVAGA